MANRSTVHLLIYSPWHTATDSRFAFSDYQYVSSSVSFASGMSAGDIECRSVFVFDDSTVEDDEDFSVNFGARSGVTVNPFANSARITILDNDGKYESPVSRSPLGYLLVLRA